MRKQIAVLLALVLAATLSACGGQRNARSLEGRWVGAGFDIPGEVFEAEEAEELYFRPDGRVELLLPNGKSWVCTYALTDDTLTLQEVEGGLSLGVGYRLEGDTLILGPGTSGIYLRK